MKKSEAESRVLETGRIELINSSGTLLIAIGNSGRQDDGLGWAFAERLEESDRFKGTIEYRYQLQIEDADLISQFQQVIFVDATRTSEPEGFAFYPCEARGGYSFSTHALQPEQICFLSQELFPKQPQAWVLAISGNEWELQEGLTSFAGNNLKAAQAFFFKVLGEAD
jgi:hydrogenase maturation protease